MGIIIGADIVPTKTNMELFNQGDVTALLGKELKRILADADYRIFNLEVPITDKASPINKCGPNLIAPKSSVKAIKDMGIDLLAIANNHIFDQGEQGILSTFSVLEENSISYVGAGKTPDEAKKPHIFSFGDKNVGVYTCVEHEFSIVSDKQAGANPFEPMEIAEHLNELKKECDYLIVLYHGGKEHYRYPSPNLQATCRKIIEKGADLVICQHSHCIGCMEEYNGKTIVYGQGNFLFDKYSNEFWQTSLLLEIDKDFNVSYIPLNRYENGVRLAEGKVSEEILDRFYKRSEEIKDEKFVTDKYNEYARSMIIPCLLKISGVSKKLYFKVFNKLTSGKYSRYYINKKYNKDLLLYLENHIMCETHRELFVEGLRGEIKRRF